MAIYHNSTKIISRSSGRSAVGASAYRSGEKMLNEYDGINHDFSRKQGVVYSEVMLPPQAKEEFKNRATLWNEVEKIEKSKNSQLAREVEVSLPKELSRVEQIKLVKSYVQDNFVKNGMCADLNIHDKGDGNPHAHVMLTMREIKENGEWGAKQEKLYLIRKQGEKDIYVNSKVARIKVENEGYEKVKRGKAYKTKSVDLNNWNSKEFLQSYREDWGNKINEKLKELGIDQRVDHRSYKEQGIEKTPTIHEGATARKIEKRGKISDRMEINRQIKAINERIKQCSMDIEKLKNETTELNKSFAPKDELIAIQNDIREIQEYKMKVSDIAQKLKDIKREKEQILTCDKDNRADIEKLKDLIKAEEQRRNSLGFFKRSEKKNCNDRINKYSDQIESLEKSLLSEDTIKELRKDITEVNEKLDIANKKIHEHGKRFDELFKKEYQIKLDRRNKNKELNMNKGMRRRSMEMER